MVGLWKDMTILQWFVTGSKKIGLKLVISIVTNTMNANTIVIIPNQKKDLSSVNKIMR